MVGVRLTDDCVVFQCIVNIFDGLGSVGFLALSE
jgi:hypothetical protein